METLEPVVALANVVAVLISSVALIVSILAWNQSIRANEISLHKTRNEIRRSFKDLGQHLAERNSAMDLGIVTRFLSHLEQVNDCFEPTLAKEINGIFIACFRLADKKLTSQTVEQQKENRQKANETLEKYEATMKKINNAMKLT